MVSPNVEPRTTASALTPTRGFLTGFSHTLNPYTGCRFGCSYCYVRGMTLHRFHQPQMPWGEYAHPRLGIGELLEKELARFAKRGKLGELTIFMSSATDPYQPLERKWRLSRSCLEAFLKYPPALLNIQTRSPIVADDFGLLRELGDRCWINYTLETDLEEVRRKLTPRCPPLAARLEAIRRAREMGLRVQITVSPCLPCSSVAGFGQVVMDNADHVLVDTYISGDATGGSRTAGTDIPELYAEQGWGDWRAEDAARELYDWLHERMGERAGWSKEGFAALPLAARAAYAKPATMPFANFFPLSE